MAEKYGPIFEAITKKNLVAYAAGDIDAAAEMYDPQGVIVDRKSNTSYFGTEQHKKMIAEFLGMGKCEFAMLRKELFDAGGNRFLADTEFESNFVESGVVMKGSSLQLYHKVGDQWKCVYEVYSMQ